MTSLAIDHDPLRHPDRFTSERARLIEANRAKSSYLAAASHDLRQPLHALGLFVGELRHAGLPAAQAGVVEQMEAALRMGHGLLDGILSMARLESGSLRPDVTVFPVQALLSRVTQMFGASARDKRLKLVVVPSEALVRSDPAMLERIVFNLVSNAIRYTATGGVLVACRPCGGKASIEVWDTGVGIPEEFHAAVFEEFFRIKNPGRDGGGLGLGLSIVKGNAALLSHRVALASRVGKGSRFSVAVPWGIALARAQAAAGLPLR